MIFISLCYFKTLQANKEPVKNHITSLNILIHVSDIILQKTHIISEHAHSITRRDKRQSLKVIMGVMVHALLCKTSWLLLVMTYDCPPHLGTSLILSKSNTIRAAHGSLSGHRVWMSLSSADSRRREMHYTVRAWNHSLTSPALLLSYV